MIRRVSWRGLRLQVLILGTMVLGGLVGQAQQPFKAKETSFRLFGDYLEESDNRWGGGYALDYFATDYLGLGATSYWQRWKGASVDNLAAEMILRLPIQKYRLAPYVVGTAGYDFERSRWYEGAGGGIEYRFKKGWGIFGDYQYLFRDEVSDSHFVRFGLRFGN